MPTRHVGFSSHPPASAPCHPPHLVLPYPHHPCCTQLYRKGDQFHLVHVARILSECVPQWACVYAISNGAGTRGGETAAARRSWAGNRASIAAWPSSQRWVLDCLHMLPPLPRISAAVQQAPASQSTTRCSRGTPLVPAGVHGGSAHRMSYLLPIGVVVGACPYRGLCPDVLTDCVWACYCQPLMLLPCCAVPCDVQRAGTGAGH